MPKFSNFISFVVKNPTRTQSGWNMYECDNKIFLKLYFKENKCGAFSPTVYKDLEKLRQIDFDETEIYVRVPKLFMESKGGLLKDMGISYARVIKAERVSSDMAITLMPLQIR